jgi:TRAP-type C4-dicarboxylate transport system permease small subunit
MQEQPAPAAETRPRDPFAPLHKVEDGLLMLILVGMILLSFLQIVLRNIFDVGLIWIEPLLRQMLLWVSLLGAIVATRNHNHITIDAVARFVPEGRFKYAAGLFADLFALAVCSLLAYATFSVFQMEYSDPQGGNIVPGLPLWASLATLPAAFGIMALRFVRFTGLSFRLLARGGSRS